MAWKQGLGTTYQAYSDRLAELAQFTAGDISALADYATVAPSAFALTLLDDADVATARGTLGLVIGTDVQAYDADLTTLGAGGASARSFLGLGTGDTVTFTSLVLSAQAASLAMNSQKITGLGTPTASTDAATKAYVDGVAQGLHVKDSVKAATTANITLSGTQTIDGVSIVADDRVLVKDQTTGSQNGIYVAAAGAWSRSTDMAAASAAAADFVFVQQGTNNGDAGFVCTNNSGSDVVGTDALVFTQFSGAGQITAGDGLVKSGNTLSVNVDNSSIEISSDILRVKAGGVTNAMIATAAGIPYSKLSLTGGIVNADINVAAAIAYSKLDLATSIVNDDISTSAAIAYSKLALSNSIVAGDIANGAITSGKLASAALSGGLDATLGTTSVTKLTNTGGLLETGIKTVASGDSSATVLVSHRWVLLGNTGACAVTLPPAVVGQVISFKKTQATGNVTLTADTTGTADLIDGNATLVMSTQYSGLTLVCLEADKWSVL